ncbi:MAG TPA: VOC family protein [Alphaproteobacteria bacterium]|nr:VOC family protein [Alphaproteobacteria bacterium]
MPSINPAFVQLGYVTNDLDQARAFFAATMGVPEFHIWKGAEVHQELYGKPATCVLNLGFAWRAGTMIELIMPVSGSTDVYMPGIEGPAFGLKLHHIGQGVDGTEADFDKLLQAGVKRGWELVNISRASMGSYTLLDSRNEHGVYFEYLWNNAGGLDFFSKIPSF